MVLFHVKLPDFTYQMSARYVRRPTSNKNPASGQYLATDLWNVGPIHETFGCVTVFQAGTDFLKRTSKY